MRHDSKNAPGNSDAIQELHRSTRSEELAGASLSGNERNHLFLNAHRGGFADVSGVSGLDSPADGRAFGILDYDRDGWLDVALVNANEPMLQLFHNRIGRAGSRGGGILAVQFVGGNDSAQPTPSWSARDGFGARVTVDLGSATLVREHLAGEGLAAQNSATRVIGIGEHDGARSVTVRWPSGREQTTLDVPAGTLLVVHENPAHSPTGDAFVRRPYAIRSPSSETKRATAPALVRPRLRLPGAGGVEPTSHLRIYTTMAAWCTACVRELPQFHRLRAAFTKDEVALFAVPIDSEEAPETIEAWLSAHQPAYEMLTGLPPTLLSSVKRLVLDELGFDAVPATLVTDDAGTLLHAQWGPPSVSTLRELLWTIERERRLALPAEAIDDAEGHVGELDVLVE